MVAETRVRVKAQVRAETRAQVCAETRKTSERRSRKHSACTIHAQITHNDATMTDLCAIFKISMSSWKALSSGGVVPVHIIYICQCFEYTFMYVQTSSVI